MKILLSTLLMHLTVVIHQFGLHSTCSNFNRTNQTELVNCTANFTDLLFVMDTSTTLTKNEFDSTKANIANTLRKFNLSNENINIAVMAYSDRVRLAIPFTSTPTISADSLINTINLFVQDSDRGLLAKAIHYSQLFILNSLKMRPIMNTKKIVVIFTHGNYDHNEMKVVRKEANLLKVSSDLILVEVGKQFKRNKFKSVPTCPEYLLNFDQVYDVIKKVKASGC
jgi:hypothetical protein